jgi:hypothetical protein
VDSRIRKEGGMTQIYLNISSKFGLFGRMNFHICLMDLPTSTRSVHIFSDPSERTYVAVVYLNTENTNRQIQVAFLAARSRVVPK